MNGKNFCKWPDFEKNFHVVSDEKGVKAIIEERADKICRYVSDDAVIDAITKYCYKHLAHDPEAQLTQDEARCCFKLWRSLTQDFEEEIVPVAQKSEDILCWHRLNFDLEPGPTPTFDEMMARASNSLALKCWIGSLFEKNSDRQQYVWIYGDGNNGKGALARFLYRVMGPSYCAQQPPTEGDRFWTSGILGKRLVVFADCNDYNWPTTGLFKSITGGDFVKIEEKGKQPYTAELNCKMLFLSNTAPNLSGGTSDVRRAIYSAFEPINVKPIAAKTYDDLLLQEASAFLRQCFDLYKEFCPDHSSVPVDIQGLEEIIDANEEQYHTIFNKYFVASDDESRVLRERNYVSPGKFQDVLKIEKLTEFKKQRAFFSYMERNFGVVKKRVKLDGDRQVNRYVGARNKTAQEKERDRVEDGEEPSRF